MRYLILTALVLLGTATAGAGQQPSAAAGRTAPAPRAAAPVSAADGATPLHTAVREGNLPRVRTLLRQGADANAANRYGVTPLALAVESGDATMVEALLKSGGNAKAVMSEGQTLLMSAARSGNPAVVRALLTAGAAINAKEEWLGQTALMWAAAENHPEVINLLVENGADINMRSKAAGEGGPEGGMGGGGGFKGGFTAVAFAARQGALEAITALSDAKADLNIQDPDGITPLCLALLSGNYDAARLLIERGADINKVDRTGRGPLYIAVDMKTLEWRFNRPAPPRFDRLGASAADLVRLLLDRGADVNARLTANIIAPKRAATGNGNLTAGSTPFLKAATTADAETMRWLLAKGADPKVTNKEGSNALMLVAGLKWSAVAMGSYLNSQDEAIEAATLLLDLGIDINATNSLGETALHGAAQRIDRDATGLIQFLVDRGAKLDVRTKKGRTPLHEALGEDPGNTNNTANLREVWNEKSAALLRTLMGLAPGAYPAGDTTFKPAAAAPEPEQ